MSDQERLTADPAYRAFVSYIDKSREFYAAQAYERPYRWARNDESPFTPLAKPLSESRLGLVKITLGFVLALVDLNLLFLDFSAHFFRLRFPLLCDILISNHLLQFVIG